MQLQNWQLKFYELLDLLIKFLEDLSTPMLITGIGATLLLVSFILPWYNDQLIVPSGGYMTPILEESLGPPGKVIFSHMNLFLARPIKPGSNVPSKSTQEVSYKTTPSLPLPWKEKVIYVFDFLNKLSAQVRERLNLPLLSFGSLALVLGILSSLGIFYLLNFLRVPVGIVALLLGITFIAKLTCWDINALERLIDNNNQHIALIIFSSMNLPPDNRGYEPTLTPGFKTDYLLDRLEATFYFASWGWYLTMAGGVFLISAGLYGIKREKALFSFPFCLGGILLILLLYTLGIFRSSLMAEYHQIKGDNYRAQGYYEQALTEYLSAQYLNNQLVYSQLFSKNLGEIYYKLGRADKPEYHLYRAELLFLEGKTREVLSIYNQALKLYPDNAVIKRQLVSLHIQQGLSFNSSGNSYSAIDSWKAALELDPNQLHAHFYLAKTYFDVSNYKQAIVENQIFIDRSINSMLKANAYSNIGDCYMKLGEPGEARAAYLKSRSLDRVGNTRMTDGLAGGV